MTEKELKKLNRYQLLELLIVQTERADRLQKQLDEAQEKLNSQDIQMTVAGSIAEVSMQLGGVFEAAQRTADIYLDAVKEHAQKAEAEAEEKARNIIRDAEDQARRILEEAENRKRQMGWF